MAAAGVAAAAIVAGVELAGAGSSPATPACTVASTAGSAGYVLSPQQAQNAAIIAAVAMQKALPDHAVSVALAASLQETHLENLPYGDLDSVGLFQQRPSQGWGSRTQLLDPVYAASAFYQQLSQIPGWQTMPVTQAAQTVQRSATPDAYAAWEGDARAVAQALTGEVPAGLSCRFTHFSGPTPAVSALAAAASTEMGAPLLATPVSAKVGWQVAVWAVAHAYAYHLRSVAFAGMTWSFPTGTWKPAGQHAGSRSTEVVVTY
jgi:hypothetical protein